MDMLNEVLSSVEAEFKHRMIYGTHKGKLAGNIIFSSKKRTPLGEMVIAEVRVTKDAKETTLIVPQWLADKYFGYRFEPYVAHGEEYNDLLAAQIPLDSTGNYRDVMKSIQFLIRNTF